MGFGWGLGSGVLKGGRQGLGGWGWSAHGEQDQLSGWGGRSRRGSASVGVGVRIKGQGWGSGAREKGEDQLWDSDGWRDRLGVLVEAYSGRRRRGWRPGGAGGRGLKPVV